ncbi:hypothetical protein EAI_15052 [Harpegnathos saltator]|uniref:Uncharacterized protein n=1 Tax=Harpegnathos saltator TaxID=610380 RepID=E2B362_HARSA|nr:hypothetical protein EAI_15052 [Harpegnathos saltator]
MPQVLNQIVEEQLVAQATGALSHQECLGGYVILRTVRRSPASIPQGGSNTTSFFTPQVLEQIVEEQLIAQATGALYQVCPIADPVIFDKFWQREDITDCFFYLATPVFSQVDKVEPLSPGTVAFAETLVTILPDSEDPLAASTSHTSARELFGESEIPPAISS